MANPIFEIIDAYQPVNGDLLIFPFLNKDTPLFDEGTVGTIPVPIDPPTEPGGSKTIYVGPLKGEKCVVRTVRIDKKFIPLSEALKQKVADHLKIAQDEGLNRIIIVLKSSESIDLVKSCMEGTILGGYKFDRYLSEKKDPVTVNCLYDGKLNKTEREEIALYQKLYTWVNTARDMLNEPPSVINPVSLAQRFQELGKQAGLKVTVWDEKKIKKEKMGALLAVGQGSSSPPRLVIGEHKVRSAKGHLILVGKGVTFDTGGYCLKPADAQIGMKYDMAGAAACFCAACAISQAKLPINVTVITPLCENAISSTAYKTTDIIVTRSGKSVQVDNTDAEGRLILADALDLASEKRPDWLVDVATLTGACVVALGEDIAGIMGQSRELLDLIREIGNSEGELFWELPLHLPYSEQLKTESADIKNIGSRWGGSITGALFLKEFVPDDIPWVHADIAGPAVKEEPLGHLGKGAKGFGVKTLFSLARRLSGKK
ncbi:Cytosol aminopeptidase PepA [Dissulfuribacter thermophilus]|uniref:Probable cytosol aminopeptidase n=1 Tax=Dissulfuribacter thermophilus TaxID=1156395 RepID=A0A1B9F7Z3_9BACT|nr:leucyl aminopeptidase family protein [Dissulfuribacter thermophilus]OCC16057.1 Cytosol aminopeptidase PepA [Dissulfuribacter thermophilus]